MENSCKPPYIAIYTDSEVVHERYNHMKLVDWKILDKVVEKISKEGRYISKGNHNNRNHSRHYFGGLYMETKNVGAATEEGGWRLKIYFENPLEKKLIIDALEIPHNGEFDSLKNFNEVFDKEYFISKKNEKVSHA